MSSVVFPAPKNPLNTVTGNLFFIALIFCVKIVKFNNKYLIEKSSNLKDAERLQRQINKQIALSHNNFLYNVDVPNVVDKIIKEGKATPKEIGYFSFTVKAAEEIRNRVTNKAWSEAELKKMLRDNF